MKIQFKKTIGINVPASNINLTQNGCTENDKTILSKLRWAEGNLNSQSNYNLTWASSTTDTDNKQDIYGGTYYVQSIEQMNPQIFAWLDLLDLNVWVILILMVGVAGFTMISGLLIIILERTQMIGILKALGANDFTIRKVFLWFSVFLIGKGMLWGNAIGIVFCILQSQFGLFKLDPETYYVSMVPVSMNIWLFLLINAGTLLTSVLMLVGPSYLITKINPADSMRYE